MVFKNVIGISLVMALSPSKIQVRNFYVVGGGCFGTQYTKWLLRSVGLGWLEFEKIYVIDKNSECKINKEVQDKRVQWVNQDWLEFFPKLVADHFDNQKYFNDQWVPSPLSPHLIYHAFVKALAQLLQVAIQHQSFVEDPQAPTKFNLPNGDLAMSHAQWRCPVNCIEPARCPAKRDTRTWEMRQTMQALQQNTHYDSLHFVQCQHLCHAVGTIAVRQIFSEFKMLLDKVRQKQVKNFAVATVSSCHGILSAARVD